MVAVGIGVHNFAEGLAIGQSSSGGSAAPPSARTDRGAPTAVGFLVGGLWISPTLELLFLSLATGSLVYVTRELLRIRFVALTATAATLGLTVGLALGFATELVVDVARAGQVATGGPAASTVRFAGMDVEPGTVSLSRGESLRDPQRLRTASDLGSANARGLLPVWGR